MKGKKQWLGHGPVSSDFFMPKFELESQSFLLLENKDIDKVKKEGRKERRKKRKETRN